MPSYIVSDLHLKSNLDPKTKLFVQWLRTIHDAEFLILLGDIFDLWIGKHKYFIQEFASVIEALKNVQAMGTKIHYFEGNHDLYLQSFWQDELGIQVEASGRIFQFGSRSVWLEHGDLINPNDRGYLFLRRFLRSKPLTWLEPRLTDSMVYWLGQRSSVVSRNYNERRRQNYFGDSRVQAMIRENALRRAQHYDFDLIVTGHLHVRDDIELQYGSKKFRSVNLGTWLDRPCALRIADGAQEFKEINYQA